MSGTLTTGWRIDSRREAGYPTTWLLSENGKQLGVSLGDTQRHTLFLVRLMDATEWSTLITLYESNQSTTGSGNSSITVDDEQDSPPTSRTMEFLARPTRVEVSGGVFEVQVPVIEVG